ncbi:MAG: pyridoxal-phosphate-dependent aminotransferase family protein [Ferrovibrionaceae bacterium]
MTLARGREFLMTPGPTMIPDSVLTAMHRPAIDLYAPPLEAITLSCLADLRALHRTDGDVYIYAANGHGAWEAALTNTLRRGDLVLVLESGLFARGWGEMGRMLGLEIEVLPGDWRKAVDPAQLQARLAADTGHRIKAVMVAQVDTASAVINDLAALRRAIDAAGHPALFMADLVASLAAVPFEMDGWGVDVAVSAPQKALMSTPGLSFVAAGPKAKAAHATADLRTLYWDWTFRDGPEHYKRYCGTCPEHLLFGLRQALDLINEEGIERMLRRHRLLAEATRRAVAAWAAEGALEFNILDPAERADSVTMILMEETRTKALMGYCRERLGIVLGTTIGERRGQGFRIAHMGHINAPTILGVLAGIETALAALKIPHGRHGVSQAIAWLAAEEPA